MTIDPLITEGLAIAAPFIAGMALGTAAMWHEANKARRYGREEGRREIEAQYAARIEDAIRDTRRRCGLSETPSMPEKLQATLLAKYNK